MGNVGFELVNIAPDAAKCIFSLNRELGDVGIVITEQEARELAATDAQTLRGSDRIRFGEPAAVAVIRAFSDCDAISRNEFCATIGELTELFYYYKTQMRDRVGDGELLALMRQRFERLCGGSCDLLARYLEIALDNLKAGYSLWHLELWEEGVPEGMERQNNFQRMRAPQEWRDPDVEV